MYKNKLIEIDCLILSSIVNSDETYEDILAMSERFMNIRSYYIHSIPFNIQNPRPVGDETDKIKENL